MGQPFNDEFYGGVSSTNFGTLTFGRQRSLGTDAMLAYDSGRRRRHRGQLLGRCHKVSPQLWPVRFSAMYKFVDGSGGCYSASAGWTAATCTPEQANNNATDSTSGRIRQVFRGHRLPTLQPGDQPIEPLVGASKSDAAISLDHQQHPYEGNYRAKLIEPTNTVYGIVTGNNAMMAAAKYRWDPFKFFAGYEYIWQNNPHDPLGLGASAQDGYIMSGVENNNLDSQKLVQIWWTDVKYSYRSKTDITFSWYQ